MGEGMSSAIETISVEVKVPKSFFRDPTNAIVCSNEKCRRGSTGNPRIAYVGMDELVASPETVPECCGEPMRVPSLAELG